MSTEFGLPHATEPDLTRFSLADAFENGEPNYLSLLSWDYGLVENLYGRDKDLSAILDWAGRGGNAATVRLVTGEGGAGKTRLAAEAASMLREQGWTAGFLPRSDAVLFNVAKSGLFLILDYPEEQLERTRALFAKLSELKSAPYPIRLLLLSRRPFVEWEQEGAILEGRFGRQAIAAPCALSVSDGKTLIAEAARRFAAVAGLPEPDLIPARQWLERSPLHALPLFAMAAAIHAVLEPDAAFGLGGGQLIRDLAKREHRRVQSASRSLGLGEEGLARLLALGVLADGLSQTAIEALKEAGAIDGDARDVVGALAHSPWWSGGRLIRLQPDRPAAAFMDLVLFPSEFPEGRDELPDWLFIALSERADTFGDRLGRIHYDLASLERTEPGEHPLDRALNAMIRCIPARANALVAVALHSGSHWSAPFAAEVALALAGQTTDLASRACLLGSASNCLAELGRHDEALQYAEDATMLCQVLERDGDTVYARNLADSLVTLANRFYNLGRHSEAVIRVEKAAAFYRKLVDLPTDASKRSLASCLHNMAAILKQLGRYEDALHRAEEALALRLELAREVPEAFTADLAGSRHNLAQHLSDLGRHEEARQSAEKAIALYSELARARPEVFTPDLANSANTLAVELNTLGRHEEALQHAKKALDLYRELARARPDAFTPDLAGALNNLALRLSQLGRRDEALARAEEAVGLYRELVWVRPDVFIRELAVSLNSLAIVLSGLERREEALQRAEQAIIALKPLFLAQPPACAREMQKIATVYCRTCHAVGRDPELELLGPIVKRLQAIN